MCLNSVFSSQFFYCFMNSVIIWTFHCLCSSCISSFLSGILFLVLLESPLVIVCVVKFPIFLFAWKLSSFYPQSWKMLCLGNRIPRHWGYDSIVYSFPLLLLRSRSTLWRNFFFSAYMFFSLIRCSAFHYVMSGCGFLLFKLSRLLIFLNHKIGVFQQFWKIVGHNSFRYCQSLSPFLLDLSLNIC